MTPIRGKWVTRGVGNRLQPLHTKYRDLREIENQSRWPQSSLISHNRQSGNRPVRAGFRVDGTISFNKENVNSKKYLWIIQ